MDAIIMNDGRIELAVERNEATIRGDKNAPRPKAKCRDCMYGLTSLLYSHKSITLPAVSNIPIDIPWNTMRPPSAASQGITGRKAVVTEVKRREADVM